MTTAQWIFVVALGAIALLITFFAFYVVSSTMWGGRWYRRRPQ
jgi:membrane protein implicated in regulation of membrane protease activity